MNRRGPLGSLVLTSWALWWGACGDSPQPVAQPQPEPEPPPAVAAEPDAPNNPGAEVAPTEAELPVPEDFADEAESEIDESNYTAVLDELERELVERQ